MPETMSVEEAGRVLGISRALAFRAARTGEMPVLRFGRRLRVPRAALERMLAGDKGSIRVADEH